jgi:hypothetical protein
MVEFPYVESVIVDIYSCFLVDPLIPLFLGLKL